VSRTTNFVELGCGTGFVSFGISKFYNLPGMSIDVQKELTPLFYRGVTENDIKVKLDFESFDLIDIREHLKPESTDLCVFNPPHYIDGRGEKNKDDVRGLTRAAGEEICDVFCEAASYLLKTKGYVSCVITPQNFENWQNSFRKNNLNIKSIIPIYGKKGRNARLLLIRGLKNGGEGFLKFKPPVFLV
jgi:tRNA1(Val) A37 N6-methylase TrmN6